MSQGITLFILILPVNFSHRADLSFLANIIYFDFFWQGRLLFLGFLFLYYYSPWADFSSRVSTHLFNGSLTSKYSNLSTKVTLGG
jgi:hypothetical protein